MDAARTDVTEGFARLAKADWPGAIRHSAAAVRRDPGHVPVVRALAIAHLRAGNLPAARRLLEQLTVNFPLIAEGWRMLGQLEWKAGNRPQALQTIARGLHRLPGSPLLRRQI